MTRSCVCNTSAVTSGGAGHTTNAHDMGADSGNDRSAFTHKVLGGSCTGRWKSRHFWHSSSSAANPKPPMAIVELSNVALEIDRGSVT